MSKGTLYIVSTPIGNLSDISKRAMEVLAVVDFIAAEDTRRTMALLNALEIQNKVISFHEHSSENKAAHIIARIKEGENCALVSDAGTPIISDPGENLVQLAVDADIIVEAIPGPTALIAALSVSGLDASKFVFEGFLPKGSARNKVLAQALEQPYTTIFYESPHQLLQTVSEIAALYPNRQMVVCKELTKLYEQTMRGEARELAAKLNALDEIKGEYVILVEGYQQPSEEEISQNEIVKHLKIVQKYGLRTKDAAKLVGELLHIGKNQVYEIALQVEKEK